MDTEPSTNAAVQDELQRRNVKTQAAVIETQKLVKAGWIVLIVGWIFPIIPFAGYFLMAIGELAALILAIVTLVKGNTKGGLILGLAAIFGSIIVSLIWIAIWASVIVGATAGVVAPLLW